MDILQRVLCRENACCGKLRGKWNEDRESESHPLQLIAIILENNILYLTLLLTN